MLKIGKLDSDVLEKLVIDKISYKRPEVKTRAGIGEDCAVIDFGEYDCIVSTDPITASVSDIGRLAIHISCNDIASNGIQPVGITLAVMLPEGTTEEDVATIMEQAAEASRECEVEIVGGHTEVTGAVNQPVIVSTAFGRSLCGASQSGHDMKPGDYVMMTKTAGLEGTGIICSDKEGELKSVLTQTEIEHGKDMLSYVSVVKEGVICGKIGTSGMHDVTEGGILGAVWEMCRIADLGAEIYEEDIPVDDVTVKLGVHFDINPLRLISSGAMLIIASEEKKDEITSEVEKAGIKINCIGRVIDKSSGLYMIDKKGEKSEIIPPEADELYKAI